MDTPLLARHRPDDHAASIRAFAHAGNFESDAADQHQGHKEEREKNPEPWPHDLTLSSAIQSPVTGGKVCPGVRSRRLRYSFSRVFSAM